jgi:hypothetical protein
MEPSEDFDDDFDDDSEDAFASFLAQLYDALAPGIKKYIISYAGEGFGALPPENYLQIEEQIREHIRFFGSLFPDVLYNHRTIRDRTAYDKAMDNYIPDGRPVKWMETEYWFDRDMNGDEEDEDTYLEDSDPIDLTELERKARNVVLKANEIIDDTRRLALFMREGYGIIKADVRRYLEKNAGFDLSVLTEEGFRKLEETIFMEFESLLDELYPLIVPEDCP